MTISPALIPATDQQRLAALRPYDLLGTEPDDVFDDLVRIVAKLFAVPIALVSLVDEATVRFHANHGLPGLTQVSRNDSVCSVVVLSEKTTVYDDLRAAPCLLTNQAAAEQLNMGFYAGHPLRTTDGEAIGALCVIDHQARFFGPTEQERLASLAGLVMRLLELRLLLRQYPERAANLWPTIYQSLETSLTRLDTLRELTQWEASADTDEARQYQRSLNEEAAFVVEQLDRQLTRAARQLAQAGPAGR